MALINLIRIDDQSGALLADEEYWRRGYRRTLTLDNMHSLLPETFAKDSGMEIVIGMDGDPSVTYDAVITVKKHLEKAIKDPAADGRKEPFKSVKDVATSVVSEIDRFIRKRINDQLGFVYGFSVDDLNRGFFKVDGEKVDIKQEKIRSHALKWLKYDEKFPQTKALFEMNALIAGVDRRKGFHWYEWSGEAGNMFLGSGLFESIGKGSDAANLAFIDMFRKRELKKRRKGLSPEEAVFSLIQALEAATRFNHQVGGYPQFVILSGAKDRHAERYREITGHGAKLAQEIVTACVHGFVRKSDALKMVKHLILDLADFNVVEDDFMRVSKNPKGMEHFLRGYKSAVTVGPGEEVR
jgi:hypothetical protein